MVTEASVISPSDPTLLCHLSDQLNARTSQATNNTNHSLGHVIIYSNHSNQLL